MLPTLSMSSTTTRRRQSTLPQICQDRAHRHFCTAVTGLLVFFCLITSTTVQANCWAAASTRYNIDPLLLYAIAKVESSLDPTAINHNRNGTVDIGLMQINSSHLPQLAKVGITRRRLVEEPCTSIMAGAQILAGLIGRHGYTWTAVGAYNAGSAPAREPLRQTYAAKVWHIYRIVLRRLNRLTLGDAWSTTTAVHADAAVGAGAVAETASATTAYATTRVAYSDRLAHLRERRADGIQRLSSLDLPPLRRPSDSDAMAESFNVCHLIMDRRESSQAAC